MEYAAYRESDEQYVPSIVKMCIWMEVSRSGFYEWRGKPNRRRRRARLLALYIRKSFEIPMTRTGTAGSTRSGGLGLGRAGAVRSLMRRAGPGALQPRPWRVSLTEGDGQEHDIPDLVRREFTADAPGEKWSVTSPAFRRGEGWLYLATVIDCHTKAVIGWAADDTQDPADREGHRDGRP